MHTPRVLRAGAAGFVLGSGVLLGGYALPAAVAQTLTMTTRSGTATESGAPVTPEHLKRYAAVLGLTPDQLAAARLLVDAAMEQHTLAQVEMNEKIGDLRAEAAESGDWRMLMEEMPPVREKYGAARERIERQFFDDLKLLLTPEQETKWDGVERTHRRLATIGRGTMAGESVDLVAMCDALDPPADVEAKLAPVLDRYEVELDRALVDRNALQEEQASSAAHRPGPGGSQQMDMQAIAKLTEQVRAASTKVRDVNESYARQIEGILTGDMATVFERMWRKESFPKVYAKTYTGTVLDAAEGFEDLTPDQRERLLALQARYERELEAANERWVQAIQETEENGESGVMIDAGGEMMMVQMGDDEGGPLDEARTARRDLNRDYLAQVRGLLSPNQRARLPERQLPQSAGAPGGAGGGGGTVEMQFIAVQDTDDAPPDDSGAPRNDEGKN